MASLLRSGFSSIVSIFCLLSNGFTGKVYLTFKKEVLILYKLLQKIVEVAMFPGSFYEASITLMLKL